MYVLASSLTKLPILSLQTGEPVGHLQQAIIDIASLELVAYSCQTGVRAPHIVLMVRDIRQLAPDCVIIDSEDELVEADDIVRVRNLLNAGFQPIGRPVITDLGRWLGTVEDYTVNIESSRIQKLYLKQPLFRAWFGGSLIVDRAQIIDITPRHIVVHDTTNKVPTLTSETIPETNG